MRLMISEMKKNQWKHFHLHNECGYYSSDISAGVHYRVCAFVYVSMYVCVFASNNVILLFCFNLLYLIDVFQTLPAAICCAKDFPAFKFFNWLINWTRSRPVVDKVRIQQIKKLQKLVYDLKQHLNVRVLLLYFPFIIQNVLF